MKTNNQNTPPSTLHWARGSSVACSMFAVLAIALLSSTPTSAQCVVGTNAGLTFGGNDWTRIPDPGNGSLDGFADFCIELWCNVPVNQSGTLVSKWRQLAGGQTPYLLRVQGTGAVEFFFNNGGPQLVSSAVVANGIWHHVAVTRSGSLVKMYVDGAQSAAATHAPIIDSNISPLAFGVFLSPADIPTYSWLVGDMDEVRIWNVARTQTQIQATMNVGLAGNEPGLVGYWRFDEGSGQTVFNSAAATGSALDGTLGANSLPGGDDPTWNSTGLPPIPYCPPCPNPPCGQVNSPCATLTVNGVGAAAQGPFNVIVPPAGTLSFNWSGPPNQPCVLVATTNFVPGQNVAPPAFVVDVNIGNFAFLFSGFDPYWGPLFFTTAAGTNVQTFGVPTALAGTTLNVQGLIYDLANTCSGGVGFATTASFSIQL